MNVKEKLTFIFILILLFFYVFSQTNVIRPMPNDENLPPRSLEAGVTTRSKATLNKKW
jgi:hypothetical protein